METVSYAWEQPDAAPHIRSRQPVMEISAPPGVRSDLPRRRVADELPRTIQGESFGITIMSHRGHSNGRLSVLLSSIPENYPVIVSSDAVDPEDVRRDREVAEHHGAEFRHCTPWGGRAKNARHAMDIARWRVVLFLCDDVWLFPETVRDALRWYLTFERHGLPIASLAVPGWETYHNHKEWGFESWEQCLAEPWRFESVPPNPAFRVTPALYKNPFGACFVLNHTAYDELGGFTNKYWAHDDVWNHQVWTSDKWVSAGYPGRGYMHLGAQSWHHGESAEWVGSYQLATGMTPDESGHQQVKGMQLAAERYDHIFRQLGGTTAV